MEIKKEEVKDLLDYRNKLKTFFKLAHPEEVYVAPVPEAAIFADADVGIDKDVLTEFTFLPVIEVVQGNPPEVW